MSIGNSAKMQQFNACFNRSLIIFQVTMKYILCLTMFCASALQVFSQSALHPGQVIVQLEPRADIYQVSREISRNADFPVLAAHPVAPDWRIYTLEWQSDLFPENNDHTALIHAIRQINGVAAAQWNSEVQERDVTPNDPLWIEQRSMSLIGLKKAWENTTGGLTPAGDTIVIAILEKGIQKEHPDLMPNLWHNWNEIPDNNIDDDQNGYMDDHIGWDAGLGGDGNGNGSSHGTSVCGIAGARGNEGYGVTGVNWNVQMMTFVNVRLESEIIAAYYYTAQMRKLYNQTNGQKGAFVVATNASFGIDNAFAQDHPLWCAVYDSLGRIGVLSVAATANASRDVDVQGDMPTTCPSEFLITVTNIDATTGKRIASAGYGSTSIDLGSPGQGTYTTINRTVTAGDTIWHGSFGGTSASCPHTTGAVGLLYSIKCAGFVSDAISQPVSCARRVRDAILFNVTAEETLADVTVTGGRLDVNSVVEDVMELCSGVTGDLEILDVRPNPVQSTLELRYQTPDYTEYNLRVFNALGQLVYGENFIPSSFEAKRKLIEVSQWPRGVYFVALGQGKKVVAKKFLKI